MNKIEKILVLNKQKEKFKFLVTLVFLTFGNFLERYNFPKNMKKKKAT